MKGENAFECTNTFLIKAVRIKSNNLVITKQIEKKTQKIQTNVF